MAFPGSQVEPQAPFAFTAARASRLITYHTFYRSAEGWVAGSGPHRWRVIESGDKPAPHFRGYRSIMLQGEKRSVVPSAMN